MKLLFPNGEHGPVELKDGDVLVGSGADCQVMLAAPGIGMRHCVLRTRGDTTVVKPGDAQSVTVLNGKQITGETSLKPGDLLLFSKIGCRVVAVEKLVPQPVRKPVAPAPGGDDDGRTRVRMALPKFMLRGVSGPTFGKTFAVVGSMTIGRNHDCDISISTDEISRHHVTRLSPKRKTGRSFSLRPAVLMLTLCFSSNLPTQLRLYRYFVTSLLLYFADFYVPSFHDAK